MTAMIEPIIAEMKYPRFYYMKIRKICHIIIISLDITPGSNGYHDAPKNFLFQLALHAFLLQLPLYSIGNGDHCVRVP
jgi:hypothetical protein